MSNTMRDEASGTSLGVLGFWHTIEFFIPYDLQGQILEDKQAPLTVRRFTRDQLAACKTLWRVQPPFGKELTGFDLFLNLFDKRELAQVTQRVLQQSLAPGEEYTQEERTDLEGLTCCAQIKVNKDGEPVFDNVSVSSAPWAMGRIARYHLGGLDFEVFQASLEAFKGTLHTFAAERLARQSPPAQPVQPCPLDANELLALSALVDAWSGYQAVPPTPDTALLVIRANFGDIKKKNTTGAPTEEDDDDASLQDTEVSIMNSFYAQDIARVMTTCGRASSCRCSTRT